MGFCINWLPIVLLLCLLIVMKKKIDEKKRQKELIPPGPGGFPILGNLHELGSLPHRSLWKLSKKYGPVMFLRLGSIPTVVISSAAAAKEVLKIHDLDCCSRAPLTGAGRLSYNFADISFAPYGDYWRGMRKICVIELFSTKRVQSFRFIREEEIAYLMDSISQSSSSATLVDLSQKFFSLTASITFRIAFGKSFQSSGLDGGRFQDFIHEAVAALSSFNASDFFPHLGWIVDKLSGVHKRLERIFYELDVLFQGVIDDHLNPGRSTEKQEDIVDVLLRLERDQTEFNSVLLTKDHIKAIVMDIFLAGVDTAAITLIWAMAELVRRPGVMKKAQDEVRSCFGEKGKILESQIDQLQYLKMIVKETLRLHPPLTFLIPREAISHFKINGYDVYPKTRIEVNVWAIGRDPDHWENPAEFFPDRFVDNPVDFKGQNFELLPFGAGRRGCPGIYMATSTVELALANLLYYFDWKLPEGMKETDLDMEESAGLAVHKKSALLLMPVNYEWPLH